MCGCNENEENVFASDVSWDGNKLVCGSTVIKPCDKMDAVITKIFKMACNGTVLYSVEKAPGGGSPAAVLSSTTYTVPTNGAGKYEIFYTFGYTMIAGGAATNNGCEIEARKNAIVIDADTKREIFWEDESAGVEIRGSGTYFISNISAVAGDVLAVYALLDQLTITDAICKITKIE